MARVENLRRCCDGSAVKPEHRLPKQYSAAPHGCTQCQGKKAIHNDGASDLPRSHGNWFFSTAILEGLHAVKGGGLRRLTFLVGSV